MASTHQYVHCVGVTSCIGGTLCCSAGGRVFRAAGLFFYSLVQLFSEGSQFTLVPASNPYSLHILGVQILFRQQ